MMTIKFLLRIVCPTVTRNYKGCLLHIIIIIIWINIIIIIIIIINYLIYKLIT